MQRITTTKQLTEALNPIAQRSAKILVVFMKLLTSFIDIITQRSVFLFVVVIFFLTLYFYPVWYLDRVIRETDSFETGPWQEQLEFLYGYVSSEKDLLGSTPQLITSILAGLGLGFLWKERTNTREKVFGLVIAVYIMLALVLLFHSHAVIIGTLKQKLDADNSYPAVVRQSYDTISAWTSTRLPEIITLFGLVLGLGGQTLLETGKKETANEIDDKSN